MGFVSLHNHTWASNQRFLDSINRPEEVVRKAIALGFSGVAFTDHESLSAAVSILKIRDKITKEHPEFKIIFGNEIYLIDESEVHNAEKYYHFILLAKDLRGWEQLKTLSSRAWERGYTEKGIMRVPTTYQDVEEVIGQDPGHIFASTACLGGRLPTSILRHDVAGANAFVRWCIRVFGVDHFSLELQPSDNPEQIRVNQVLLRMADHYQIPYIITTDSHYLDKEDFAIHSAFLNSKQSSDRETDKFYRFTYMMSVDEMVGILMDGGLTKDQCVVGMQNTERIGNLCENFDFRHSTIVPKTHIPEFTLANSIPTVGYENIERYYNSPDEQDRYLMYQIERGIARKKITIDAEKLERIDTELGVLRYIGERLDQSLSAYLNLTADIINLAWQVSLVAPGRGSSTGFYINYLIGIVQVDPLKYGLKYWRFLNKERVELPDVDTDFQPEKKDAIIQLLRDAYGVDNVLNCATFKTETLKSAILSVGRGLGLNSDEMQALAGLVPSHRGHTYTLSECLYGDEEKGFEPVAGFEQRLRFYPGLFEGVQKIEGLPTNISIHASALYVFNGGYLAHNSLMRAPNKTRVTAFDMHDSDDQGALKMDVLFTEAQSKIAKCLELLLADNQISWGGSLRKTYDKYLHPDVIDYDNPDMWKAMANGQITNLFQMETAVGGLAIKKARPENVRELAEINSIMRLQGEGEQPIDRYVRFRDHPELWDLEMIEEGLTAHEMQILHKYLDASHGVSSSQEVLMQILMDPEVSGFTLGEANNARKAVAKKKADQLIQLKKDFYERGGKT